MFYKGARLYKGERIISLISGVEKTASCSHAEE
jgi:hypothetical protein